MSKKYAAILSEAATNFGRTEEEQKAVQERYDRFLVEAIIASTHREHSPFTQNLMNERNKLARREN